MAEQCQIRAYEQKERMQWSASTECGCVEKMVSSDAVPSF